MSLAHVDPTAHRSAFYRGYASFLQTPPGRWVAINIAARVDPWLLRHSNGRVGMGIVLTSALLETTGAKSGAPRACTVLYFHDGADVILIASSYGREAHPAWYHNLIAHPDCALGGEPFRAELVTETHENERLWKLANRVYSGYDGYRERAGTVGRTIPQLRLTARSA